VTAAAMEVTVSANVEKIKMDEMTMRDATAPSDTKVDTEHHAADAAESKPQEVTAEATTAESSIPIPKLPTPEPEVSTKVVEGDIVKQTEEKHSEDILGGGTIVTKKVMTTKHVRPVTTIVRKAGGVEEQLTVDKLLGIEVDENVLVLEPGVIQLREDQLEKETQVEECEDTVEDGTWVKRKVTTVTVKCPKTSSVPGSEQFAVDQKVTQLPASAADNVEVPLKESLDFNASPQPGANLRHQDVTSLGAPSPQLSDVDSAERLESETRRTEVELDRKSEDDQSKALQSKPSIVPVKLTKLEPLSKESISITADTDVRKPAEDEQKSLTDERDTTKPQETRSGSPSLSVVRLTKLEPLSFERSNGSSVTDQPCVEPAGELQDSSSLPRAPAELRQPAEQPQNSSVMQPTTEDMIIPIPSTHQMRGQPAWIQTMTAPQDEDLELTAAVDERTIQVEQTVDQFTVAPSNITPAAEQEITVTLASTPGSVTVSHIVLKFTVID